MTLQELQEQALQLPLRERWQLVQKLLGSIQQETLTLDIPQTRDKAFPQIQYQVGNSGRTIATIKNTGIESKPWL